jgi:hypothetical protein
MAATRAGFHTFVTTTRSLAVTGTTAAAEDLMTMGGALDLGQGVEFHICDYRLGAEGLDLFESTELGQTVEGSLDDCLRVIGTHGLRKDVLVASHFEDGAHAASSDEAGTRGSRAEHHDAAVGVADDFVRDGVTAEIDADEGAVSTVRPLANRIGNFLSLAVTHTDAPLAVTRHDERGKVETTAAFDDLGATVDVDDLVVVFGSGAVVTVVATGAATRTARTIATTTGAARTARATTIATRTRTARSSGGGGGRCRGGGVFCAHEIRR